MERVQTLKGLIKLMATVPFHTVWEAHMCMLLYNLMYLEEEKAWYGCRKWL